ncbi:MAG TPA: NosD domain-containing protein [Thermoplasmata archaeon]|nr:NosD domain-containing protein [Thermoplasmata archaeon]
MVIEPNGRLSNLSAPITVNGSTYTLTGNLSGGLADERNGSSLDGAGHWIHGNQSNGTFALLLDGLSRAAVASVVLNGSPMLITGSANVTIRSITDLPGRDVTTPVWVQLSSDVLIENSALLGEPPNPLGGTLHAGGPGIPGPAATLGNPALSIAMSSNIEVSNSSLSGGQVGIWADAVPGLALRNDTISATTSGYTYAPNPCPGSVFPPVLTAALINGSVGLLVQGVSFSAPYQNASLCYGVPAAVIVQDSVNVSLSQDALTHSDSIGLFLSGCANSSISGFAADHLLAGVVVQVYQSSVFSLLSDSASFGGAGAVAFEVSSSSDGQIQTSQANATGIGAFLVDAYQVVVANDSFAQDRNSSVALTEDDLCSVVNNDLSGNASANATGLTIVNSTRLTISNNSIGGWGSPSLAAVSAVDLRGSTLSGNIASGAPVGIHLTGSYDDTLSGNLVQLSGSAVGDAAIELNDSGRLLIEYNRLLLGRVGILGFGGGDDAIVGNNLSFDTQAGLLWHEFENLTIASNVVVDDGDGIDLVDGAGYTLIDDTSSNFEFPCSTCVGVFLEQVSGGWISASNFSTMNIGVYAVYALNLTVRSSDFYNAGYGVLAGYSTGLTVRDNRGGNDLGGVEADWSRNLLIENNSFGHDIAVGIELMMSSNATVSGNTALDSLGDGLALWDVTDFVEAENTLNGDLLGLRIENSTGGEIAANVVANCTTGFRLLSSSNLTFVHNNFEFDGGWTIAAGSGDLHWDGGYPIGGNYWSNATGSDTHSGPNQSLAGADGILDRPVAIAGYGADRYPLAVPWQSPSIVVVARGLPTGTLWSVSLRIGGFGTGSADLATNGSELSWAIPYAAWVPVSYRVGLVAGYLPASGSGQFTTDSGVFTLTLIFAPFTLPVTFVERGLANGTNWSVTIGTTSVSGIGPSLNFMLSNGTYAYAPGAVPGYYRLAPGTLTVSGGAAHVLVNFTAVDFYLEFVEFGLANGTTWQLAFDGLTQRSTLPALEFSVPNGSYAYRVLAVTGYTVSPPNGSVTVRGNPVVIRLEFTSPPPPPPPAPPPPSHTLEYELAALAGVLAALALAGWLRGYRRGRGDRGEPPAEMVEENEPGPAAPPEAPLDPLA